MPVPSLEEALAALDAELGRSGARTRPARAARSGRPTRDPSMWVDWACVAEWCYENPHKAFTADPVHANAVYRFRKRFPDLVVEGRNHRHEPDGRRVATFKAWYDPAEDDA
jgi:hypothetical protein